MVLRNCSLKYCILLKKLRREGVNLQHYCFLCRMRAINSHHLLLSTLHYIELKKHRFNVNKSWAVTCNVAKQECVGDGLHDKAPYVSVEKSTLRLPWWSLGQTAVECSIMHVATGI